MEMDLKILILLKILNDVLCIIVTITSEFLMMILSNVIIYYNFNIMES